MSDGTALVPAEPRSDRVGTPRGPGRPKGSKNRATKTLESTLERLQCDPVSVLARVASNKKVAPDIRVNAAGKLMEYLYPKRKAVELANADGEPFVFQFVRLDG